ncbi:hypothetical protein LX32DRAFT_722936 [Colletotrichum zoysiae]|uniref:Uncharacterized protein n=1 Tax=Colletotrichum zoysiae TaxID=1216348 RepID=A0AAD9HF43_9PEZI|nr:hypothetical protein LX32DRAFT_722936 [Colletotrichum zoysiae]
MVGISTLPVEIIREICYQMRDGDAQVDYHRSWVPKQMALSNFCRTSKVFDHIARPVFYNRIEINVRQNTLTSLTRTLASRSDLSKLVRHLKLKSHGGRLYKFNPNPGDDDIVRFTEIFRAWWPESVNYPDLYRALCARAKRADVLYILMPNIETMSICPCPGEDLPFVAPGDEDEGYDSFASFTSLRRLSVNPLDFAVYFSGPRSRPSVSDNCIWDVDITPMKSVMDTLPNGLEVFKVTRWFPEVTHSLVRLGEMTTQSDLPKLELLEVQCHTDAVYTCEANIDVYLIKEELQGFEEGSFTLPLRISVYNGDGRDPSAQALVKVLDV